MVCPGFLKPWNLHRFRELKSQKCAKELVANNEPMHQQKNPWMCVACLERVLLCVCVCVSSFSEAGSKTLTFKPETKYGLGTASVRSFCPMQVAYSLYLACLEPERTVLEHRKVS